jgi:hypothetical protein
VTNAQTTLLFHSFKARFARLMLVLAGIVFWQGFPTCGAVYWLPWLLLAVDKTVRHPGGLAPIGLSVVTCLVLVSGHLDVAAQVLLASGLYALWCLADASTTVASPGGWYGKPGDGDRHAASAISQSVMDSPSSSSCFGRRVRRSVLVLTAAWTLGFLLAAPYLFPVLEYTSTGARMARRAAGLEERPPVGIAALPQTVLPDFRPCCEQPVYNFQ